MPLITPGLKGDCLEMRCVRLRCGFLKLIKKQMPHFTLFREIGICFFISFENHHPRPKTAHFRMYTFVADLSMKRPVISKTSKSAVISHLFNVFFEHIFWQHDSVKRLI